MICNNVSLVRTAVRQGFRHQTYQTCHLKCKISSAIDHKHFQGNLIRRHAPQKLFIAVVAELCASSACVSSTSLLSGWSHCRGLTCNASPDWKSLWAHMPSKLYSTRAFSVKICTKKSPTTSLTYLQSTREKAKDANWLHHCNLASDEFRSTLSKPQHAQIFHLVSTRCKVEAALCIEGMVQWRPKWSAAHPQLRARINHAHVGRGC